MAGLAAGLAGQFGIANETIPGTAVPVTTFLQFNPGETLERRSNFDQSTGIRGGGLVPLGARRVEVSHDGGGGIAFDLPAAGLGKLLQHCLGSHSTVATLLAASAYQQIHNLGSSDGKTFTGQKGIPSRDGTVNPMTLSGCKVTDWTLAAGPNAIATLALTVDAMDIAPTGAGALGLQVASYAPTGLYAFHQLTISQFTAYTVVAGLWTPTAPTPIPVVRNFSLKGGQPKDVAGWVAGSQTKVEQLVHDYQPITGQLDVDYQSNALYTLFSTNAPVGLQFTFTGALIGGTNNYMLQFTLPMCFFEQGSTPKVSSTGITTVSYPFTALDDGTGTGGALQARIVSTDVTV